MALQKSLISLLLCTMLASPIKAQSDYLEHAPLVATTALNLIGVDGYGDTQRFLCTAAATYAITASITYGLKHSISEKRPDGTDHHSFPSGHTALCFAGATLLHHEYGLTRSLWYSVGGYAVATTTAILRVTDKRHWVHDVAAGAAIGVLSTEAAYALSKLVFKDTHLRNNLKVSPYCDYQTTPMGNNMIYGASIALNL